MRGRWRLFPKYALLIITVVGGMLVASGVIGVYFSWRETEANLVSLQVEKAESAATRIEQYILDIAHQISWTGLPRANADGDALEERKFEYLKLFKQAPAITEVAWIDPSGHEQLRISRLAMNTVGGGTDVSQEPKFREASAGRIYYGPVYFRKGTEPYMTIARPAGGGGVTAAEVNLKFVWEVVSRIRIGEKGAAFVVDDGGLLIAHPDISLVLRRTDLNALPQVAALKQPDASARPRARGIDGMPALSAHAPIPTLRWTVFVESPETEAFAPLYASIVRAALLLGAGLLLSMVASFFVARALVRPLQALQEGAMRIGTGDLDRRIEVRTGDEIESLAEQFNKMAADLKESYSGLERKVEQRTSELTEALEQQTATAEILRVISSSPTDVQPVFEAIAERAMTLCEARVGGVARFDGEWVDLVAFHGVTPEAKEVMRAAFPMKVGRGAVTARAILERAPVQIEDVLTDPDYTLQEATRAAGFRSNMAVPMMRDGEVVGSIAVCRAEPGRFPERLVRLLQTFANQAVIAIENVRLFNETREALERQTATAEILKVIAASPDDVQPVFDAIAASSNRLLGGHSTAVWRFHDDAMHLVGFTPTTPEGDASLQELSGTPLDRFQFGPRIFAGETVRVIDTEDPAQSATEARDVARARGFRSMVITPLRRDNASIGMLSVTRREAGQFAPHQVELLQTFADQAVIAIENVRLFNETKEALDQQTATAEVLGVISSSVSDTAPVFEKILESCQRLFASSEQGVLLAGKDGRLHLGAHHGSARERLQKVFPVAPDVAGDTLSREQRITHFKDVLDDPDVPQGVRAIAESIGVGSYSQVIAPMMWEGESIGSLYVIRQPPVGFSDKEIGLLRTFADQAVIAIQNARLFNETKEALEQQTATAGILRVISGSITDAQPVFEAIVQSCRRLFGGKSVHLAMPRGDMIEDVAFAADTPGPKGVGFLKPWPLDRGSGAGTCILDARVVAVPDTIEGAKQFPRMHDLAIALGYRSCLFVPLLKDGKALGSITVLRETTGSFEDKEIALAKTFADQAVIAIENVRLFNETNEGLRQQTAIAGVLKVISQSTFDLERVLTTLIDNATQLCEATHGFVFRPQGDVFRLAVSHGASPEFVEHIAAIPVRPERGFLIGRVVLERRPVQILDALDDPDYQQAQSQRLGGYRTMLGMPMLSGSAVVGVIVVWRQEVRAFTDKQIELLTTFADQAVIAIENVRLFNETNEALERQTATAEVLKVISASPTDVGPVLRAVAERAGLLCKSEGSRVWLLVPGDKLRAMAEYGPSLGGEDELPLRRSSIVGRAFLERRLLHVEDVVPTMETEYPDVREMQARLGFRTVLAVPMLRDGQPIGVITLLRRWVQPFPEADVSLVQTFADQAVIAIENTRLFNETREALEQQIATSEVLQAISNSVADTAPVFDKILAACERLFAGNQLIVFLLDEQERLTVGAIRGPDPERVERARRIFPVPLAGTATEQAIRERRLVTFADVLGDPDVPEGLRRIADQYGESYSVAVAPMLWEGRAIGSILVGRPELRAFDDKEQRLLRTFADQAVIAIQNARLFNETKEALEQQTATANVLQVISSSVSDTAPVFEKILDSCQRLFATAQLGIFLVGDDGLLHSGAFRGALIEGTRQTFPRPLGETTTGLAIQRREPVYIADALAAAEGMVPSATRAVADVSGSFSAVFAPMLWEGTGVGSIGVLRQPPRPFSHKEVNLLKTFADQAVIAIQNARLFNETKEALEQQTATSAVLQVISSSVADTQPVFDKILDSCERLFAATGLGIYLVDAEGQLRKAGFRGVREKPERALGGKFPRPLEGTATEQAIRERRVVHYPDVLAEPKAPASLHRIAKAGGSFSIAFAPMLWEGRGVGAIQVSREPPQPFSDKELALLKTFADQAVIAIQNARLFNETKEALEQQTATAEVLQVISSSVADTQPVFDKILDSCTRLFSATGLGIYLIDDTGMLQRGAFRAKNADSIPIVRSVAGEFPRPLEGSTTEIAIRERRVVHFADVLADAGVPAPLIRVAAISGNFSIAFAPMIWEGRGVGAIQVSRDPPQAFTDKELALLKTFADQAVIAIQNARLFNEIQSKSRELEQANKHKSEFLANMSHELRTPLNAIIGFSEVLSEKMFGEVNEKQLEYLLDIHSSGQHLLSLINDILDLSKIEAGRMELDLASTSLPMLLDNCTTLVRERASRQGLVLALEVDPGVADWVADVRKLKQVVINLLSNAVKFTPAGGRVTLRARRLEHAVEIAVVDTGVGIAEDQQALVFEEFRQAGGDYLRKAEGTGLGLSLAKRFVELHGGTMRVESKLGQGSTFAFILPERVVEAV